MPGSEGINLIIGFLAVLVGFMMFRSLPFLQATDKKKSFTVCIHHNTCQKRIGPDFSSAAIVTRANVSVI